ncbi:Integrase catalytic domain-containing protein [Citrus sinensis]|nr:Integrase catalytic domain-containing protein [Citrus sinensis]
MKIINDKWNEMDGNTIVDLHLVLEEYVLSSVVEEKDSKGRRESVKNKENRQGSSQQAEALTILRRMSMEHGPSGSHSHDRLKSRTMQEEIEALHKNKTWELIPLPHGRKVIGNKWIYQINCDGNDQVEQYRARLVVKVPRCWYKRFNSLIKNESDEESELDEEEMDMLAWKFRNFFKKSSERRKFRDLKNRKEKKEVIKCYECKKLGHIRSECPLLNKLKKKAMVATWDDSEEETSDDEEHQEMTNLALMPIGDESNDEFDEQELDVVIEEKPNMMDDKEWIMINRQTCDGGIVRHFTIRDTPQQNRVAECMNRTILKKVQCILSNAGLGKEFWAKAVVYVCHLINRLPSAVIEGKTLMEMWTGKPATDYDSLQVFGSTTYYHVKESKLDPRGKKALFMGITSGAKGHQLWCPVTKKINFSRDVTFDESVMLKQKNSQNDDKTSSILQQLQEGSFLYLLLYVDDMLIASKSKDEIEKLKTQLNQDYDMKNLEREYMLQVPYSNAVGSLMYAIVCTRLDISHAIGIKTMNVGLLFKRDDTIGQGVIGWKSALQSTVALSTTEVEYMAIAEAVKEAIWLQGFLESLGLAHEHINVYCDSQNAIHLTKKQVYNARTKHNDIQFHFLWEIVDEGKILLQKIKTAENPADMLTKVVTTIKFEHCLNLINILQI